MTRLPIILTLILNRDVVAALEHQVCVGKVDPSFLEGLSTLVRVKSDVH